MATYDYVCKNCNREWEASHPIEERHDEVCQNCGCEPDIAFWSGKAPAINTFVTNAYPLKITDLGPKPEDEHVVHSKYEHKELLKMYQKECPAFM